MSTDSHIICIHKYILITSVTYKTTISEFNTTTHHSKITIVPSTHVQEYYANHCLLLVS